MGSRSLAHPAPRGAQVPDRQVPAAARARRGRRSRCSSPRPCRGSGWPRCTTRALLERIRTGTLTRARAARARPAVVRRAGRARPALGGRDGGRGAASARARRRDEPRRRHAPRGARLRPRLLPVQRRRGDVGAAARRGCWCGARWSSTATCTRATAPRSCSARTRTRSRSRCTAPATIRSSASRPTSTSIWRAAQATTTTWRDSRERWTSRSPPQQPEIAFFLAGADPWEGDRLGRLALTKEGLCRRDELVLDRLLETGAAVVVVLAGGYAPDVRDTVDINAATVAAVAARDGVLKLMASRGRSDNGSTRPLQG